MDVAGAQTLTDFLIGWWVRLEGRNPSLKRKMEEALEALTRLPVGVDAFLQNSQRRYLLRRLDTYIEQIEELTKSPGK